MLVNDITKYAAQDQTPRWKVTFEGDDRPLILRKKPWFESGAAIPKERLRLAHQEMAGETREYYVWIPAEKEPEGRRPFGKVTPDILLKEANIERQVVLKAAVDCYTHCTEPGKGFSHDELQKCYDSCRKIIDKDKVAGAAKELGAAESD